MNRLPLRATAAATLAFFLGTGVGAVFAQTHPGVTLQPGDSITITAALPSVAASVEVTPSPIASPTPTPTALVTPTPTPTPTASPPSGDRAPQGDIPGWRQVFVDDFDAVNTVPWGCDCAAGRDVWTSYPRGWDDTSDNGRYGPENITVHDGVMDLHLRTVNSTPQVAAPVPLIDGNANLRHGRYVVRARLTNPIPGYKTAWLLWPSTNVWPRDGEIDFPEGQLAAGKLISAFMHRQGATQGSDQDAFHSGVEWGTDWHTFIVERAPTYVSFQIDGRQIGRSTNRLPTQPMRWVLQSETLIRAAKPPAGSDGHILIDWVAIYVPD